MYKPASFHLVITLITRGTFINCVIAVKYLSYQAVGLHKWLKKHLHKQRPQDRTLVTHKLGMYCFYYLSALMYEINLFIHSILLSFICTYTLAFRFYHLFVRKTIWQGLHTSYFRIRWFKVGTGYVCVPFVSRFSTAAVNRFSIILPPSIGSDLQIAA